MKKVSKESLEKLSENLTSVANETNQLTDVLKKLVIDMAESKKKINLIKLKNKECLQQMWFEKMLQSKWYNRWYYKTHYKSATKEYFLCAGRQYILEQEIEELMKNLDDIDKSTEATNL
jgi:hypothetical protein